MNHINTAVLKSIGIRLFRAVTLMIAGLIGMFGLFLGLGGSWRGWLAGLGIAGLIAYKIEKLTGNPARR